MTDESGTNGPEVMIPPDSGLYLEVLTVIWHRPHKVSWKNSSRKTSGSRPLFLKE